MGGRTAKTPAPSASTRAAARKPIRPATARTRTAWRARAADLRPMLAVLAEEHTHDRLLGRDTLVFEPKYDGIRALIEVDPAAAPGAGAPDTPRIRIWSRLGNDKTAQFREVVDALAPLARTLAAPLLLDGEIVAVDAAGAPLPFQHLQGRMHLRGRPRSTLPPIDAAFIAFDLLRDGDEDLRRLPFTERRARLTRHIGRKTGPVLRLIRSQTGGGTTLREEALANDWEGVIAKDPAARYLSGTRHPGWQKIKFVKRQEFVVAGWTAGRLSRSHFGALLVGYYAPSGNPSQGGARSAADAGATANRLVYAGHVGSGFSDAELEAIGDHLRAIETDDSPFDTTPPPTNEQTHWVHPRLVIDVKFTQWTADEVLRNPVYLGVRTDKRPEDVRREDERTSSKRQEAGDRRSTPRGLLGHRDEREPARHERPDPRHARPRCRLRLRRRRRLSPRSNSSASNCRPWRRAAHAARSSYPTTRGSRSATSTRCSGRSPG